MNEDDLRQKVLIPLFEAMGYHDVTHHHGGPLEQGKDIVMWKHGEFDERCNFAVVAKRGKISGSASGLGSAGEVLTQIQQAFGSPFKNPVTGGNEDVHRCLVVCPVIKKEALNAMQGSLIEQGHQRVTTFLHGDKLWGLIEGHLPARTVVAKLGEAQRVLNSISDRYHVRAEIGETLTLTAEEKTPGAFAQEPHAISGTFEFPDTPDGREGAEAIQRAMETGAIATLPGEFLKGFQLPEELRHVLGMDPDTTSSTVKITSNPPNRPFLLRLEVEKDGVTTGAVDYLDLRAEQVGNQEMTFSNEAQPIPLKLTMVISVREKLATHSWGVVFENANVHQVLEALRFQNALAGGGTLRTIHFETGFLLGEKQFTTEESGIEPVDPFWMRVIEDLDSIQQKINIPIILPNRDEVVTREEANEIVETAAIFREGRFEGTVDDWTVTIEKRHVDEFFNNWPAGKPHSVKTSQREEREILGIRFDMGDRVFFCRKAFVPTAEARRVVNEARDLGDSDQVKIRFRPFRGCPVVIEYPKWLPSVTSAEAALGKVNTSLAPDAD